MRFALVLILSSPFPVASMDPYSSYVCPSDFEAGRPQRSSAPVDDSKLYLAQQPHQPQQQQQLPPFRELLGTGAHSSIEPAVTGASTPNAQGNTMTRRTFHTASGPLKIEPPSPERLQTGSSFDNFDSMSAQSADSAYGAHRHHRQNSSWTSPSHYTELVSPYSSQQRAPCTVQTQFSAPKPEPSLPSIHDLTYNQSFPIASPYAYGGSAGAYTDHRSYPMKTESPYSIKTETHSYYEPTHRYGQSYQQMNRPQPPTMDYQRYPSALFDYPKSLAYSSPYGVDYIPSPTGSHHAVSPTVSNGDGCGGPNRRRRGNLPKHITDYLKNWFLAHLDHPYPTEDEKQQFVHDTQLTLAQISNWFINARRRHLPTWRHQAQENSRRAAQASAAEYDSEQGRRSHKSFD